ncbi:MAG TPA: histidine phosphatase family protein [Planctomycetaceae bacterium]|jgi:phosphohistidine phosphatase|nr:histidine phosphatase family protein [Planctomycetaceae bacterium]
MKTLLLLRHAKASRDDPGLPDHDRPLKPRGKEDAKRLGRQLREAGVVPTLIVSSTALRARKTASKVAKQMSYPRAIELNGSLYLSSPRDHLEVVRSLPDAEDCVMLVGHNPGLSQFLDELADIGAELATSELAQLELPLEHWAELEKSVRAELIRVWQAGEGD